MKVLLAHHHYGSTAPRREDQVFRNEVELLHAHGIEVTTFERFNDEIDESTLMKRIQLGRDTAWSKQTYLQLTDTLARIAPDIMHFHNTFPLISPSAYSACHRLGIPVVQTLHNTDFMPWRFVATRRKPLRIAWEPRRCQRCVIGVTELAARHKCAGVDAATEPVERLLCGPGHPIYRVDTVCCRPADSWRSSRDRIRIKPIFLPGTITPGQGMEGMPSMSAGLAKKRVCGP